MSETTPPEVAPSQTVELRFTSLVKRAWGEYRARFGQIVLATVGAVVAITLIFATAGATIGAIFFSAAVQTGVMNVLIGLIGFIVAAVISAYIGLSYLHVITDPDKPSYFESLKRSSKHVPAIIWLMIITFLITAGGLTLLVIPGIALAVGFCLAQYILVHEDIRGFAALRRSQQYIKGHGWTVFVMLFLWGIVTGIVSLPTNWMSNHYAGSPLAFLGTAVLLLVIAPLGVAFSGKIYETLRAVATPAPEPATSGQKVGYSLLAILGVLAFFVAPTILFASLTKQLDFNLTTLTNGNTITTTSNYSVNISTNP